MNKILKIIPLLIFGLISILLQTERVRFGYGMGDILYHGMTYLGLLIYAIIFFFGAQIPEKVRAIFTILFIFASIYLLLSMSVWRGGEYQWNGNILVPE